MAGKADRAAQRGCELNDDLTVPTADGVAPLPDAGVMVGGWSLAEVHPGQLDRRPSGALLAATTTAVTTRSG